jgi:mannose-6-phosphate isomerase-like protein (cupin superfamily)
MKAESIKSEYGSIKFFRAKEASFNIETILPKRELPRVYLKRNKTILMVVEGILNSPKGKLKKDDVVNIKPRQRFWLKNNSNKIAKFLAIHIPPLKDRDIVWVKT